MSVLEVALALLLVSVLVMVITGALAWRAVVRRNRISVTTPTPAPLWWLVLPTEAARLHRRLRAAVITARLVGPARRRRDRGGRPLIAELVDDLEAQAVAIDLHVVAAGRGPARDRRRRLRDLEGHVRRVEELSARLVAAGMATAADRRLDHHPAPLDDLGERLDALDAAGDELAAIELALGLRPGGMPVVRPGGMPVVRPGGVPVGRPGGVPVGRPGGVPVGLGTGSAAVASAVPPGPSGGDHGLVTSPANGRRWQDGSPVPAAPTSTPGVPPPPPPHPLVGPPPARRPAPPDGRRR